MHPPISGDYIALWHRLRRMREQAAPRITGTMTVLGGVEEHLQGAAYDWDGQQRGADPANPFVVFQYTLGGRGQYQARQRVWTMTPGTAFAAVVPSAHRYRLPDDSEGWRFFWLIVRHPYAVTRLTRCTEDFGPVATIPPDHVLMARALRLLEGVFGRYLYPDRFAEEQTLFEFVLDYERFMHHSRYAPDERQRLLDTTRSSVLKALHRGLDVAELGALHGMSRSHFTRYFKATTGITPARYIVQVRLEEATHRLLHTSATLAEIAQATGFSDANHLCKVFRRAFHMSPGEFRKQLSSW